MSEQMVSPQVLAGEAASWFERRTRLDESRYVTLRDGASEWLHELVRDAHGDMLPDDWRYSTIRAALEAISEVDDPDDYAGEFADGMVDTYNSELIAWLGSHSARAGYVDRAREEFGVGPDEPIYGLLRAGQYAEASEVYHSVLVSLRDRLEELES